MAYEVPAIPYVKLRFHMEARSPALLPPMKGSMLRGALGHALRATVCAMGKDQSCTACLLKGQCAYTQLFETFVDREPPPHFKGLKSTPRPFIIHAPNQKREYAEGDRLAFEMTLLGRAAAKAPYLLVAFDRAAKGGLTQRKHPFRLTHVEALNGAWNTVYDGKTFAQSIPVKTTETAPANLEALSLRFATPTRIVVNSKLTQDFSFRELCYKMLSRALEVAHFHVDGVQVDWTFQPLLQAADEVNLSTRRLRWVNWKRFSSRQRSLLDMGGFVGQIGLEGDLAPLVPLLRTAEVLHVGKGTVFGNGRVKVENESNEVEVI